MKSILKCAFLIVTACCLTGCEDFVQRMTMTDVQYSMYKMRQAGVTSGPQYDRLASDEKIAHAQYEQAMSQAYINSQNKGGNSDYVDPSTLAGNSSSKGGPKPASPSGRVTSRTADRNSSSKGGNTTGDFGTSGSVKPRPPEDNTWHIVYYNTAKGTAYGYINHWVKCPFCDGKGCFDCENIGWVTGSDFSTRPAVPDNTTPSTGGAIGSGSQ
jgi:hypothetical protein